MRSIILIAAVLTLVGCEFSTVCTLIGCDSGLTVQVQNAHAGPITIQARVSGDSTQAHTMSCTPSTCGNSAFFRDFTPTAVQLVISTSAGTRTQDVTPTYVTSQPNGKGCSPTCRNARVTVAWQ